MSSLVSGADYHQSEDLAEPSRPSAVTASIQTKCQQEISPLARPLSSHV